MTYTHSIFLSKVIWKIYSKKTKYMASNKQKITLQLVHVTNIKSLSYTRQKYSIRNEKKDRIQH